MGHSNGKLKATLLWRSIWTLLLYFCSMKSDPGLIWSWQHCVGSLWNQLTALCSFEHNTTIHKINFTYRIYVYMFEYMNSICVPLVDAAKKLACNTSESSLILHTKCTLIHFACISSSSQMKALNHCVAVSCLCLHLDYLVRFEGKHWGFCPLSVVGLITSVWT